MQANSFILESPNNKLIAYGLILIVISIIIQLFQAIGIAIGLGVAVRILILLWIPRAADSVGRNSILWTIFAFIFPPIALIILGVIGYKETRQYLDIINNCRQQYNNKQSELSGLLADNKITREQMDLDLSSYHDELSENAKKLIAVKYAETDEKFLNAQLERQGYVTDENSEVFVDYKDKCPACGASINKEMVSCPDCGLGFK